MGLRSSGLRFGVTMGPASGSFCRVDLEVLYKGEDGFER